MSAEELRAKIREIPDFPKPGILFYDITTLLKDAGGLQGGDRPDARAVRGRADRHRRRDGVARLHLQRPDGLPARRRASSRSASWASCRPRRSPSSTPSSTARTRSRSIATRSQPGQKVLIVDDLLATGGTVQGTIELVERLQGRGRRPRRSWSSSSSSRVATGSTAGASRASSSTDATAGSRHDAIGRSAPRARRRAAGRLTPSAPSRAAPRRGGDPPADRAGRPRPPAAPRSTSAGGASSAASPAS